MAKLIILDPDSCDSNVQCSEVEIKEVAGA